MNDQTKRIIYPTENAIAVIIPAPESPLPLEEIALKDVPKGAPFRIVDEIDIPADRTFRGAWEADFSSPDGYGADWGAKSSVAVVGYDAKGQARKFRNDEQDGSNSNQTVYTRSAASIRKIRTEIAARPKGPGVTVNLDRAKAIAHSLRRAARSAEFAPIDALMAAKIPGTDEVEIEKQRQEIRDRYAIIQSEIDEAVTVVDLTAIAGGLL